MSATIPPAPGAEPAAEAAPGRTPGQRPSQGARTVNLCLLGFGNVVRALLPMLSQAEERIALEAGVRFVITAATTRSASFLDPQGMSPLALLQIVEAAGALPGPHTPVEQLIAQSDADVAVEATVMEHGGHHAAGYVETAFRHGMDVVTVNKGPVAWHYHRLQALAESLGRRWRFEGTVADGLPVFDLVEECLQTCTILGFDGILNATTNYILEAMGEGRSYADALAHAQREGFAEADPANDIDGLDAACKVACLASVLMGAHLTPDEIRHDTIRTVTGQQVAAARAAGRRLCVLCSGHRDPDGVRAEVRLTQLPLDHPLATLHGSALGLVLHTDLMGDVLTAELHGEVQQTAYAVLADLLRLTTRG